MQEITVTTDDHNAMSPESAPVAQSIRDTIPGDCCVRFKLSDAFLLRGFAESITPYAEWSDDMKKAYEIFHQECEENIQKGQPTYRDIDLLPILAIITTANNRDRVRRIADFIHANPGVVEYHSIGRLISMIDQVRSDLSYLYQTIIQCCPMSKEGPHDPRPTAATA